VIISVVCLLVRCLLSCLPVLTQHQVSKDAGLLVVRHENTVLRRQAGRVRYEPAAGCGWRHCRDWFPPPVGSPGGHRQTQEPIDCCLAAAFR
jgi:hypothetical protein